MNITDQRLITLSLLLALLTAMQVKAAPVAEDWTTGLIHRAKRSLLWRWNMLKPIGASCREHSECGTKYCRKHICTFRSYAS